ncbi:hypothetical protein [Mastigocladopsis repens]|uniref:hypothetical protein n=1 Tax=Mastigocladopsis repens TaxID=221287 RepID=UPI001E4A00CF|nr:hypothetical protein [Mastigocladopsis repens]
MTRLNHQSLEAQTPQSEPWLFCIKKTTREAIEREKQLVEQQTEQKQRELSARYIKAIVELLRDNKQSRDLLQQKIDKTLKEVAEKLILEEISQESFRTFIEAYKTTRDAIERN